jgi:hypothetical protein
MPARTRLDYGCLLFISPQKNLKQKPHTHVFPSHMVAIVYIKRLMGELRLRIKFYRVKSHQADSWGAPAMSSAVPTSGHQMVQSWLAGLQAAVVEERLGAARDWLPAVVEGLGAARD